MTSLRLFLAVLLCFTGLTPASLPALAREAGTEHPAMVVAAHPLAAEAGSDILAAGGSAADAAVAVQAVLSLVEPQSSGIGGGAFMLYYDAATGKTHAYDGRETAPKADDETLFLGPDGEPLSFLDAGIGGRAVGVPGVVAMLEMAQKAHGALAWRHLFDNAIALAEDGFAVTPRYNASVARMSFVLERVPETAAYFMDPEGNPLPVGHIVKNPEYARSLRLIAEGGAEAFYTGALAETIVETVRTAGNPGKLGLDDMANYEAKERAVLCRPYRSNEVCTMPPPTSGGLTTLQMLGMLEHFDLAALPANGIEMVHLMSEASRLAYADRGAYIGDPDFIDVPVAGMLDEEYLAERAALIAPDKAMTAVAPGTPPGSTAAPAAKAAEPQHTSHFTIVDSDGNIVSMTTSVQIPYGSALMAGGFILNNQLTDFEFAPRQNGQPVANRPEGGKRPRSSMSPTIVFDADDRPLLAIGSPGGARIIGYVTQSLVGYLDSALPLQDVVTQPHHGAPKNAVTLEAGTPIVELADDLEAMGHTVEIRHMESGLHGIAFHYGNSITLEPGVDPRREGAAVTAP